MDIDPKILSAIISCIVAFLVAYLTTKWKSKQDFRMWNIDFAVPYAKLLISDPQAARKLARHFAVGMIIVKSSDGSTHSKHFIPYQCKISIGRGDNNDIVLEPLTVSRDHGVIFFNGKHMIYQDFAALNKTIINKQHINDRCILKSGDHLMWVE